MWSLLEARERWAEFVDGGVGDGLPDGLVDLLSHVRGQLVDGAGRRAHRAAAARPPTQSHHTLHTHTLHTRLVVVFVSTHTTIIAAVIELGTAYQENLYVTF